MRYLWVEDFDGGKTGQDEIKRTLEKYFELENRNINKRTLEDALMFLDDPANWKLFDAILIDIRFKVCDKIGGERKIYQKYFSNFLTVEKYNTYTYKISGDANTASSGVLFYLALIHKYNYNQDRIAFVSANVDESSDRLADINNMREIIYKAKYCNVDENDKNDFSILNENVFELFCEVLNMNVEDANKIFSIPETDNIDWNDLNNLEKQINAVAELLKKGLQEKDENDDFEVNLKYNSVKEEFESVGLKLPMAFEKPGGACTPSISWKFKTWVDEVLSVDYYKLRTAILPICIDALEKLRDEDQCLEFNFHNIRMSYNRDDERSDKDKTEKIICLLEQIIDSFPDNITEEKEPYVYTGIIRQCVSLCDEIRPEKGLSGIKTALKSVLIIVRNWISHQGINNIRSYDVAFVFYALVSTFLSDEYLSDVNKLLLLLDENTMEICDEINSEILNMIEIAKKRHYKAYGRYIERVGEENAKKNTKYYYKEESSIYDIISSIGNEYSDLRETVNMEYIYLLYLGILTTNEYAALEKRLVKRLVEGEFSKI